MVPWLSRCQHSFFKVMLDTVCSKLRALPMEIASLKGDIEKLNKQVKEYRQLIPLWNQDKLEDIEDAYNEDAPVHRQVFSMKDKRSFAGLGLKENVPPYLRAEGFIRHLFISKGELEDFMQEFIDAFFSADGDHEISTESMHNQLYQHMMQRCSHKKDDNPEALTEFAYAFICSLEAYRDDPDFELFDLMLSGAVHPSIMRDQREMLGNIEALTRACQEASGPEAILEDKARRKGAGGDKKEQVSRRVIRAVLEVVFPDKKPSRQDALRQALYVTMQILTDAGKTPAPDCVYTGDLFAAGADGSQTPLVEEIRRQHVYEVIEWTAELARRCLDGRVIKDRNANTNDRKLMTIIEHLDPHCSHQQATELVRIAFPEPNKTEHVREVMRRLRHGALLRPKRLWIRSEPKEVVKQFLNIAHLGNNTARNSLALDPNTEGGQYSREPSSRRTRAVKVLNNPVDMMNSDAYNDPDALEQAVLRAKPS